MHEEQDNDILCEKKELATRVCLSYRLHADNLTPVGSARFLSAQMPVASTRR